MTDYTIESSGLIIQHTSERSTRRAPKPPYPAIGARLAFKTKHDVEQFVAAGEREGFVFEGKQFLAV
jgi:hypothetical protein